MSQDSSEGNRDLVISHNKDRVQLGSLSLVSVSHFCCKLHPGGQTGQDVRSSLQRSYALPGLLLDQGLKAGLEGVESAVVEPQ